MKDNLIQQLKNIRVEADAEWKQTTRNFLLAEIRAEELNKPEAANIKGISWAERIKFVSFAWRPVGALALVGLLFLSVIGATTAAAQKAMPGDRLFAVKKVMERMQDVFTADSARKVELASTFLGYRVDELQKMIMQETQLVSANGVQHNQNQTRLILAVKEVNKQLEEVDNKIEKLKNDSHDSSAVAALILNEKIQNYQQELSEAKKRVKNKEVGTKIDEALSQAGEVNNHILEVIVDKQETGKLDIDRQELTKKIKQHIKNIEDKVSEVEQVLASKDESDVELKKKAEEAKEKIESAKKAIAKNEYKLVLALTKDSNSILKTLYGDVYQIITVKQDESKSGVDGQVKGAVDNKKDETASQQQVKEGENGSTAAEQSKQDETDKTTKTKQQTKIKNRVEEPQAKDSSSAKEAEVGIDSAGQAETPAAESDTEYNVGLQ